VIEIISSYSQRLHPFADPIGAVQRQ
jgi:hypothetical protein